MAGKRRRDAEAAQVPAAKGVPGVGEEERRAFEAAYETFRRSRGEPVKSFAQQGAHVFMLCSLYYEVKGAGGYDAVGSKSLWGQIAAKLLRVSKRQTTAAKATQACYEAWLLPFEPHASKYLYQAQDHGVSPPAPAPTPLPSDPSAHSTCAWGDPTARWRSMRTCPTWAAGPTPPHPLARCSPPIINSQESTAAASTSMLSACAQQLARQAMGGIPINAALRDHRWEVRDQAPAPGCNGAVSSSQQAASAAPTRAPSAGSSQLSLPSDLGWTRLIPVLSPPTCPARGFLLEGPAALPSAAPLPQVAPRSMPSRGWNGGPDRAIVTSLDYATRDQAVVASRDAAMPTAGRPRGRGRGRGRRGGPRGPGRPRGRGRSPGRGRGRGPGRPPRRGFGLMPRGTRFGGMRSGAGRGSRAAEGARLVGCLLSPYLTSGLPTAQQMAPLPAGPVDVPDPVPGEAGGLGRGFFSFSWSELALYVRIKYQMTGSKRQKGTLIRAACPGGNAETCPNSDIVWHEQAGTH
ncbi:unnamed protein product [Ostreobium quekettii]|uniref:ARID domain-containing protein n=1 Tax=Ostreobium quekettii TaxID=121088 RepID=A0A8S1IMB6_9CHLO|nr:unnamed protein product [Ostreobium quekettii]